MQKFNALKEKIRERKWSDFSKIYISRPLKISLNRPMKIMLISTGTLFSLIFGFQLAKNAFIKYMILSNIGQPVSVSTVNAAYEDWQTIIKASGSLRAVQGVDVTTEISGMVQQIKFVPGDEVQAEDTLVILNNAAELANLESLEAGVELAKLVLELGTAQYAIKAISKTTLASHKADLKSKEAQLQVQKINLLKKTVRAPFAGRLGICNVNIGQYLNPGDKITTLQALDPLYANFNVPQQMLANLKVGQEVEITVDSYPNKTFDGKITAINSKVDPTTRNVQIEATVVNTEQLLMPGMFAKVMVFGEESRQYLTLPQTAISYNPYGEVVYVVKEEKNKKEDKSQQTVRQAFVKLGEVRGDQVAILEGIELGDMIVTSGQLKLRPGASVVINNTIVPNNSPNPKPEDE